MISNNFIWLALVVAVFGNLFYIRDTLKGRTQPNRVTFFLWGSAPLITYFAQRAEHAGAQILYTLVIAIVPFLILASSFVDKKAYWKITGFDIGCGAVSLIALFFLVLSDKGYVALVLSILADFFASLPTIIKSYKHPESETPAAYAFEIISSFIVILTIHHWIFVDYAFSLYVLLMNLAFTILLLYPRKTKVLPKPIGT